jgi:C4-dicarboxylate transporter DctQ subunit
LKNLKRSFEQIEDGLVILGIVLTMLITFGNVITRYVFHVGAGWSEELVRFIMIWVTFIGMSIAIRTGSHVSIDFFVKRLGGKMNKEVYRIGYLLGTSFCLFLFVSSVILTFKVFRQEQISAGLQIPMGFIYLILPVTTLISTFRYFILVIVGETEEKQT